MRNRVSRSGFTMVELSLSIAFIAVLSIAVVLIITNAISAYHRGITLSKINTVGTEIVDDVRAAVQNSPARSIVNECSTMYSKADIQKKCQEDGAHNFVSVSREGTVEVKRNILSMNNNIGDNVPLFGAFCTGMYSYIWNTGYFFSEEHQVVNISPAKLKYKIVEASSVDGESGAVEKIWPANNDDRPLKLLKVRDDSRSVCISAVRGRDNNNQDGGYDVAKTGSTSINSGSNIFDITSYNAIDEEPIDLLVGSDVNLAIYDLYSSIPAEGSSKNNLFYSISFILGSVQGGINVKASGNYCTTPSGYSSAIENFDYCAINKFNFAVQAVGG